MANDTTILDAEIRIQNDDLNDQSAPSTSE